MNGFKTNKITKKDFLALNEDDVMFITNPGRMGDEDGTTFVIKKDNLFTFYRIDGWMYPSKDEKEEYKISLDDVTKQFPKWYETWKNSNKEDYQGKYKYLYMGFGNGLSVDNSIYNEFEPYLNSLVEKYLNKKSKEEKESLQYAAVFDTWEKALMQMINSR
ncbi:MAG: hypothetical protein IKR74_04515 [Bacilli bacterium]|nr:hypothetical protein [Bacilli bacterium]